MNEFNQLDIEIANKVMEWNHVLHPYVVINGKRHDVPTWIGKNWSPDDPPAGLYAGHGPIGYSNHIAAAWKIVERMEQKGWRGSVSQTREGKWRCSFTRYERTPRVESSGGAWADTAPEAICRAALDALGEQNDGD